MKLYFYTIVILFFPLLYSYAGQGGDPNNDPTTTSDLTRGIYIYKIQVNDFVTNQKDDAFEMIFLNCEVYLTGEPHF